MPKRGVTVSYFNSQRHIAVPRSLGTVLGYDQTDPAYLEGLGFQDRSLSPDPPGIRKPSVHQRMADGRCKMGDGASRMVPYGASTMEGVSRALLDCRTPFCSRHHAIGFAFLCKVSQSLRLTKHRRAIYEDFCRQPSHLSMILVENGYSIKNHGKLSGMPFPRDWLFRHRKAKTRRRRYAEK